MVFDNIYTAEEGNNELVEAFAVKDGRFIYYSVNKASIDSIRKLIDTLTEPPVVRTVKRAPATVAAVKTPSPVLKKKTSVPSPKIVIASPDLEDLKKNKKKKKTDKKKKDKEKEKDKKKKK